MNVLAQNWIWVLLAVAVFFVIRRGFHGGHHGGFGGHGMGHGGTRDYVGHDGGTSAGSPETATDPVSGEKVHVSGALTAVYNGRVYYFASKETRERFEAAPSQYALGAEGVGYPAPSGASPHHRKRHGC
jgi:YHS domain-containing protein